MKRFLATAATAAILATGGVAVAGAATSGSSGSSTTPSSSSASSAPAAASDAGHARRGLQLRVARLAVDTAAHTIGISTKDLVAAVRGGQTVAEVAQAHNVEAKTVEDAITAALDGKVDDAVQAGKLDATRAATIKSKIPARVEKFVEHTPKHAAAGVGARQRVGRGLVATAAKAIGIEPKDLLAQLKDGKTVAQVAQAHNVDPQTVVDAIVKAGTQRLEKLADNFVNKIHQR